MVWRTFTTFAVNHMQSLYKLRLGYLFPALKMRRVITCVAFHYFVRSAIFHFVQTSRFRNCGRLFSFSCLLSAKFKYTRIEQSSRMREIDERVRLFPLSIVFLTPLVELKYGKRVIPVKLHDDARGFGRYYQV